MEVESGRALVLDEPRRDVLEQAFDGGPQHIPHTSTAIDRGTPAVASYFQGCLDTPTRAAWTRTTGSAPARPIPPRPVRDRDVAIPRPRDLEPAEDPHHDGVA